MRNGLYFGLYRLDDRFVVDRYFGGKDWHYVDFAKIAEFYRDIDAKDPELHWDFGDTLGFFDLAESDVRDEDVEHGDPAAIPENYREWAKVWLELLNWSELHHPDFDGIWETLTGDNGRYQVEGIHDWDDDALLVYDHGDIRIISKLEEAK